jgi:hypothetical protein
MGIGVSQLRFGKQQLTTQGRLQGAEESAGGGGALSDSE